MRSLLLFYYYVYCYHVYYYFVYYYLIYYSFGLIKMYIVFSEIV